MDLASFVTDVRLDLTPLLAAADARLTLTPRHLRSIVYKLLSNAVKYRHPDRPA